MVQVSVAAAAPRLAELIDTAERGEAVVIVQGDHAVRLVPVAAPSRERARRRFGSAAGQIHMAPDFDAPLDDFAEYTR